MTVNPPQERRGPEAERVKIEGMDWQEAVAKALHKRAAAPTPKAKKGKLK